MDGEAERNSDQAIAGATRGGSCSRSARAVQSLVEVRHRRSSDESDGNSGGKVTRFRRNGMRAPFRIKLHVIAAADFDAFQTSSNSSFGAFGQFHFPKDKSKFAVAFEVPGGTRLNHQSFQTSALRKDEFMTCGKRRLGQNRAHRRILFRRSRTERRNQ